MIIESCNMTKKKSPLIVPLAKGANQATYCLLCAKHFVSAKNLKRHSNYAHKLCEPPAFVCDQCHTGFVHYEDYEKHHSDRLLKVFHRKTKRRNQKTAQAQAAKKVAVAPAAVAPAAVDTVLQQAQPAETTSAPSKRRQVLEPFFDHPFFDSTSSTQHVSSPSTSPETVTDTETNSNSAATVAAADVTGPHDPYFE